MCVGLFGRAEAQLGLRCLVGAAACDSSSAELRAAISHEQILAAYTCAAKQGAEPMKPWLLICCIDFGAFGVCRKERESFRIARILGDPMLGYVR